MIKKLTKTYSKIFVGKTFVYKSKYGGFTECVCSSIQVHTSFSLDEKTTQLLCHLKDASLNGTPYESTPEKHKSTIYHQPKIYVKSTVGNMYEIEECWWLDVEI